MKFARLAVIATAFAASGAIAQDVYHWPLQSTFDPRARRLSLPIGTPVLLATRTRISTKDVETGQRIFLHVAENVTVNGQIVVPAGAPAFAEVSWSEKNGHFGKRGSLGLNLLYMETPSGPVQVSGNFERNGHSGTALSVGTIALVSPLGFLIHGTSATIPPETAIPAYFASALVFTEEAPQQARAETAVPVQADAGRRIASAAPLALR